MCGLRHGFNSSETRQHAARIPVTGSLVGRFRNICDLGEGASPVIQEAWIGSVSIRGVDDLVQAMGLSGIRRAKSPSCAKTSVNESTPSSIGRSKASGGISGSTLVASRSATMAALSGCGDNCRATLPTWLLTEFDAD